MMVTGSHHQQVYWYPTGDTRILGQLPIVFLIEEKRWVPRKSTFLRAPTVPSDSETGRWNTECNQCHATHGKPRFVDSTNMDTYAAEFGIACESCHGPGESHVRNNHNPVARYHKHLTSASTNAISRG